MLIVLIILWTALRYEPFAVANVDDDTADSPEQKDPVSITADELIGDESTKSAEFIGNVKAVRGEYTLTTDRLVVFFDSIETPTKEKSGPRANIREIIAEGRVQVVSDRFEARADRAVYDRQSRTIVLTGESTQVSRNGSRLRGDRIIVFMETGEIVISGQSGSRVQGVFDMPSKN